MPMMTSHILIFVDSPKKLKSKFVGKETLFVRQQKNHSMYIKGPFSGLRQFLTNVSPLKLLKNAFYFILKAIFVLEVFKVLS